MSPAALPIASAELPAELELVSPNSEPLGFLRELINDSLSKQQSLARQVSSGLVDLLENAIRTGFYFDDAKTYLSAEGKFVQWVAANFDVSYVWLSQLRRLSKHFARDLVDSQQRARLGICPQGLDTAIGPHVRNQVTSTNAKSLRDLFRLTGIF